VNLRRCVSPSSFFVFHLRESNTLGCEAGALEAQLLAALTIKLEVDRLRRLVPRVFLPGIEQPQRGVLEVALRVWRIKQRRPERKRPLFECFPYVCPEPVLVK